MGEMLVLLDVCLTGDTFSFIIRSLYLKKSLINEFAKTYRSCKHRIP